MKPHLIALHGAGMNAAVFGGLAPHLAAAGYGDAFQPLNLPGHRADDDVAQLLSSIGDMAQWLLARIDGISDAPVILLGHSMGAAVALAAARHPRVAGVIALGAAPTMPVNERLLELAGQDSSLAQSMVVKWSCDAGHPQVETVRDLTAGIMATVPAAALAVDLAACDSLRELPAAQKPVLVISGAFDKMTPADRGAALAAQQGGGQLVLQAGHMMHIERPEEVAAAVLDFMRAL